MKQMKSPFKFLDSYQQEDVDIFFGREQETDDLYDALSGVKHLLVYGPSGAGKTSLVECGLRNQFSDADWYALTIRRATNLTASVFTAINEALSKKIALNPKTKLPLDETLTFGQAIENLFSERYQPVYLLFDQFEELLILGTREEKVDFFTRLNQLIRYKVPCRVMLIMREEFIGHLSEFEHLCPSIFQHRFRLEKMGRLNVREVILQILEAPRYRSDFLVKDSENLTDSILSKLPDEKQEIELTHVQVFINELWERANKVTFKDALPVLHEGLIEKEDNLEKVLDSFLKKQLSELELIHGEKVPLELLAAMISERHTKWQLSENQLTAALEEKGIDLKRKVGELLQNLETRRIVRTLKSGEETRYEISHDLLALVVGQNLTEEMKMRERAGEVYKVYEERTGYFSQDDLDYLRPYQQYKDFSPNLGERIVESEAHIKEVKESELKKAKDRLRTVRGLLILALLALLAAGYFGLDANRKKEEAQKATTKAETNLRNLEKSNAEIVKFILKNADKEILKLDYEAALETIHSAADLKAAKSDVAKAYLEIAFWFGETGEVARATGILYTAAALINRPLPKASSTREIIKKFDAEVYAKMMERYYFVDDVNMVTIEGGQFKMGEDETLHPQEVSHFRLAKYETTWWQYYLFCKVTGHENESPGWGANGDNPVVNVSWFDAVDYADWLNKQFELDAANGYRLPTEAEWEYAAKGGKYKEPYIYSGSNQLDSVAWYDDNSKSHTHPVGEKKSNALGLYDMSGNVWEWCGDWYGDYPVESEKDYKGVKEGVGRVFRGGSWVNDDDYCRSSSRNGSYPDFGLINYGFRLARAD